MQSTDVDASSAARTHVSKLVRCSGRTKAGKRCKRNALVDREYCKQHLDDDTVEDLFALYVVPPDCKPLLAAYDQLHIRRKNASAAVERQGMTIIGKDGGYTNPAVAIERQTAAELGRLHREIVRSSTLRPVKSEKSAIDQLAAKRRERRAGPAGTSA